MSLVHLGRSFIEDSRPAPMMQAPRDALEGLTKYLPIETITLFVAAMATMTALTAAVPAVSKWHVYGLCAAFTPLVLWLSAFNAFRKSGATDAFPWPWWRMAAATVAFLVWSLSVPPMLEEAQRPIAGLGALLVSTFLTLFDPLFDKPAS